MTAPLAPSLEPPRSDSDTSLPMLVWYQQWLSFFQQSIEGQARRMDGLASKHGLLEDRRDQWEDDLRQLQLAMESLRALATTQNKTLIQLIEDITSRMDARTAILLQTAERVDRESGIDRARYQESLGIIGRTFEEKLKETKEELERQQGQTQQQVVALQKAGENERIALITRRQVITVAIITVTGSIITGALGALVALATLTASKGGP